MLHLTYNGVMHTTNYSPDSPNAGAFHGMFKMNFNVEVTDAVTGELVETAHGVKTIFHDNVNRQSVVSNFNLTSIGSVNKFRYTGHVTWNGNGIPVSFEKVVADCG